MVMVMVMVLANCSFEVCTFSMAIMDVFAKVEPGFDLEAEEHEFGNLSCSFNMILLSAMFKEIATVRKRNLHSVRGCQILSLRRCACSVVHTCESNKPSYAISSVKALVQRSGLARFGSDLDAATQALSSI